MSGKPTILVFREECEFSRTLREHGFDVVSAPLITTRPVPDLSFFREALANINRFDGIFITSSAAAAILAEEASDLGADQMPPVYVLGNRSKRILEEHSIAVEYKEKANTADELLDQLDESGFMRKSILFIRGDKSLRTIPERLGKVATVQEAVVYETVEVNENDEVVRDLLRGGKVEWLCFFSPSAVESFASKGFREKSNSSRLAAIGETTGRKARSLGLQVDFVSERASAIDFANGLARYIKNIEQ